MAALTKTLMNNEATIWIYMPQGIVTQEQAAIMMRILSLSRTSDLPDKLMHKSLEDTRLLINRQALSIKNEQTEGE